MPRFRIEATFCLRYYETIEVEAEDEKEAEQKLRDWDIIENDVLGQEEATLESIDEVEIIREEKQEELSK